MYFLALGFSPGASANPGSAIDKHSEGKLADWTVGRTSRDFTADGVTGPRTILAWHTATCYLEMGQSRNENWLDEHSVEEGSEHSVEEERERETGGIL